ncbi:MAG: hypothetical protein COX16_05345 [Deltaproteobacteria bacterium CG23_combo_of_CG06-09_8_20_14_all_51_20]|nr:hypothetical protein [Deltaproteobacteria bacterium]PIP47241.1 MAG: hypothetical protein COX16_05345 [Deltaproteobacteria bacterium CG23_combo_of_CG06-09_8_20_14_all_51_20]
MHGPFEVVGVLGEPPLLTCGLARLLALWQVTKLLPLVVTVVRGEKGVAVLTLSIFDKRHDLLPPGQPSDACGNTGRKWFEEGRKQEEEF